MKFLREKIQNIVNQVNQLYAFYGSKNQSFNLLYFVIFFILQYEFYQSIFN